MARSGSSGPSSTSTSARSSSVCTHQLRWCPPGRKPGSGVESRPPFAKPSSRACCTHRRARAVSPSMPRTRAPSASSHAASTLWPSETGSGRGSPSRSQPVQIRVVGAGQEPVVEQVDGVAADAGRRLGGAAGTQQRGEGFDQVELVAERDRPAEAAWPCRRPRAGAPSDGRGTRAASRTASPVRRPERGPTGTGRERRPRPRGRAGPARSARGSSRTARRGASPTSGRRRAPSGTRRGRGPGGARPSAGPPGWRPRPT